MEFTGPDAQERADYLDACRQKRNVADYDCAGMVSEAETAELTEEALLFRDDVRHWLRKRHPELPALP